MFTIVMIFILVFLTDPDSTERRRTSYGLIGAIIVDLILLGSVFNSFLSYSLGG